MTEGAGTAGILAARGWRTHRRPGFGVSSRSSLLSSRCCPARSRGRTPLRIRSVPDVIPDGPFQTGFVGIERTLTYM
jgi:hypothetical protein